MNIKKSKATSFEVDCYNVVSTHKVILTNIATGKKHTVPAISWYWKNSFYANVTFLFRGKEYTVLAEVHPEYGDC